MRGRWVLGSVVGAVVLMLGLQQVGSQAVAGDPVVPVATAGAAATLGGEGGFTYVGSTACKKCHLKEHKSWAATKMGKAIDILKPGNSKEAKEKFKLDPAKDYSTDATCLKCHTVGFGKPGGYAVPTAGDEKAAKDAAKLEHVGCEACHGPGSAYVKVFEEIQESKRKYKVEELHKAGLTKIEESTCTSCHSKDGPTADPAKPFDYAKQKEEGLHERVPMKQREG